MLGDCHIDLRRAVVTAPLTTIDAQAIFGAVTILVPDGVEVRLTGTAILGSKSAAVRAEAPPGAPVIEVRATAVCGSVTVRAPNLRERLAGLAAARIEAP